MSDELVRRLQHLGDWQAADRIEAQAARIAELEAALTTEKRRYISQYWVMDEENKPMLRMVAGPFAEEQEAYWEMDNRPGLCVVETRHPIYQLGEE